MGILGPDWGRVWPSWTMLRLLRYLEATALLLGQSWSYVRPYWAMCLVLHPKMPPPPQQDQDFKWVSASYVGSISGSSTSTSWLRWWHLGANFGDFGAVLKAMWDHFGPCCFGIVQNNPKIHLRNTHPDPEGETDQIKNRPKTQKLGSVGGFVSCELEDVGEVMCLRVFFAT